MQRQATNGGAGAAQQAPQPNLPPNAPGYYYYQMPPELRIDPREAH